MKHSDSRPPSAPDPQPGGSSQPTSRERGAEDLLAECLALSESEWSRAIRDACEKRPDLAEPLEQLFRNVHAIDHVLRPGGGQIPDAGEIPAPSILGDFELVERVGGGGMGIVYRARQTSLNRTVALKLIRPEYLFFAKSKERFRRETEAISRLHHPGIVPLFEAGEENGLPFFAMEFIEGQSLARILNVIRFRDSSKLRAPDFVRAYHQGATAAPQATEEGIFSSLDRKSWAALCCRIVARVAHALEHAHQNGVIHRDIKPSNIMITDSGRVVIVDFGLALSEGAATLTRTGSHPGSLPYMSPEQIAGRPIDLRTDVYSLGVTLYELLALRCPFTLTNSELARKNIASGAFERLRSRNRAVSPEIEAVCLKAMDLDRERRYPTAAAFAEDLANAVTLRPIRAQTFGWSRRLRQLALRHPARTLSVCALFLLLVVGPLVFAYQQYRHVDSLRAEQDATRAALSRAAESEEESRAASEFLTEVLTGADPSLTPKKDLTVREALTASAGTLKTRFAGAPRLQIRLMSVVASVYENLGMYDEAKALLQQAIGLTRERFGPKDIRMTGLLCALSERTSDLAEAEVLAREAIEIAEMHPELDLSHASEAYGRLSTIQCLAGRLTEAEDSIRTAIVSAEAAGAGISAGTAHRVQWRRCMLTYYGQLADLLRLRGVTSEARRVATDALTRHRAEVGDADPFALSLLAPLNDIELDIGDFEAAQKWALDALRITTGWYDADHPYVLLASLMVIKSRLQSVHQPIPSIAKLDALVDAFEKKFSRSSDGLLFALLVRADVLGRHGRFEEAEATYTQVLERKAGLERSPTALMAWTGRARMRYMLGRLEDATKDATRALEVVQNGYGVRRQAVALRCVAACQITQGHFADAEAAMDQAKLSLAASGLGESLDTVMVEQMRASAIRRQGRFLEAESIIKNCLSALGGDDPTHRDARATALKDLGNLYYAWGDLRGADVAWKAALALDMSSFGDSHPVLMFDRVMLAFLVLVQESPGADVTWIKELVAHPADGPSALPEEFERHYLSGLVHWREGDHAHGCDLVDAAFGELGRASKRGSIPVDADMIAYDRARFAAEAGSFERAEELARAALTTMDSQPLCIRWLRERTRILIGRCLARTEQYDDAKLLLEEIASACQPWTTEGWNRVRRDLRVAREELSHLLGEDSESCSRPIVEQLAK